MAIYVKDREEICRERAKKAADLKYDKSIEDLWEKFKSTKKTEFYVEKKLEVKRKIKFEQKMFLYFMENYVQGDDMFCREDQKKKYGRSVRSATKILLDALKGLK